MALLSFSMGLYSTLSLPPSTQHLYSILYHLYIFLFLYKPDYVYFIWQLTSSIKIHLLFFTSFENAVEQQQKKVFHWKTAIIPGQIRQVITGKTISVRMAWFWGFLNLKSPDNKILSETVLDACTNEEKAIIYNTFYFFTGIMFPCFVSIFLFWWQKSARTSGALALFLPSPLHSH